MTTTKQIFTGDASQLQNVYKDLAQQVTRLEDELHKATTAGTAGHDNLTKSIRAGTREVLGMAQSYVGLAAVLASVTQRWDEVLERGRNALELQLN